MFQKGIPGLHQYYHPQHSSPPLNLESRRFVLLPWTQQEPAQNAFTDCFQLTFHFGVIHSFVFCAFDSQLNTIPR